MFLLYIQGETLINLSYLIISTMGLQSELDYINVMFYILWMERIVEAKTTLQII